MNQNGLAVRRTGWTNAPRTGLARGHTWDEHMNTAISLVPDALRPNWMRATWEGAHGSSGIHAQLSDTASGEVVLRSDGLIATGRASGDVHVPDLAETGSITRALELGLDGHLSVSHNLLTLPKAAHGSGYARALNDHAFARYADAGIESVKIHAALSVGGYAWARQGFELNVPKGVVGEAADRARGEHITNLVTNAVEGARMSREQYDSIADRLVRPGEDLPSNALVRIADLANIPEVGKAALLRSDWYGTRPIEVTRSWWQQGNATTDASNGASLITRVERPAGDGIERSRAIDATIDAPYGSRTRAVFESAIAGDGTRLDDVTRESTSSTWAEVGDDGLTPTRTLHSLHLGDGRNVTIGIEAARDGTLTGSQMVRGGDVRSRQAALDDAWRSIGITTLDDASATPTYRKLD